MISHRANQLHVFSGTLKPRCCPSSKSNIPFTPPRFFNKILITLKAADEGRCLIINVTKHQDYCLATLCKSEKILLGKVLWRPHFCALFPVSAASIEKFSPRESPCDTWADSSCNQKVLTAEILLGRAKAPRAGVAAPGGSILLQLTHTSESPGGQPVFANESNEELQKPGGD